LLKTIPSLSILIRDLKNLWSMDHICMSKKGPAGMPVFKNWLWLGISASLWHINGSYVDLWERAISVMWPSSQTNSAEEGRRIYSQKNTSVFLSQFCWVPVHCKAFQNMKKCYEYLPSKSCFKIEMWYLEVKIQVILYSLILWKI